MADGPGKWSCIPPTFRPDLTREIDLIEEVVRLYGYDKVEPSERFSSLFQDGVADPQDYIEKVRDAFAGLGFSETYNNSLVSAKIAHFNHQNPVSVINPLTDLMTHTRSSLLPGLLANLQTNFNFGNTDLKFFEIGNVYFQDSDGFEGINGKLLASAVIVGRYKSAHLHNSKNQPQDFFTAKGYVTSLMGSTTGEDITFFPKETAEYKSGFELRLNEDIVGQFGEISDDLLKIASCEPETPVFGFTLYLEKLTSPLQQKRFYQSVVPYPGIERDLNFVVDQTELAGNLENTIRKQGGKWLKSVEPVDVFTHSSLGEGKKSILLRLRFQSDTKTLEDSEVNPIIDRIIKFADKENGAKLRS